MKSWSAVVSYLFLTTLAILPIPSHAHGDGLPPGGKTIAGPGNAVLEKTSSVVVLESNVPIPAACISIMNMTEIPVTIWLNDAPTKFVVANSMRPYGWGKGIKKVSLRLNDPKEPNPTRVSWRIDEQ